MRIYALTPCSDTPSGGIRHIYRHVDVLNDNGFSAYVVHPEPGFRAVWFENDTKVIYEPLTPQSTDDIFVLPEVAGPSMADVHPGFRKVIFNQNAYYTFRGYLVLRQETDTPYLDPEVIATIVVSEDSKKYLEYVFPEARVYRIHYGVPDIFSYSDDKLPWISFMPRKNTEEVRQVVNILKFRRALDDFQLMQIEGLTERGVADFFTRGLIFLSFGHPEGFGLPAAEAMACGCIVIGNTGGGGREFFKEEFSYPVAEGDVIGIAKAVEEVIGIWREDKHALLQKGKMASDFVRENYSPEREAEDIVDTWNKILSQ